MAAEKKGGIAASFFFHYVCFTVHLIGMVYHTQLGLEAHESYGGRFKFLTFINMVFQLLYYNISTVTKFQHLIKRQSLIFEWICDIFFSCFAFPLGMIVCLLFWGLYVVDPHTCQTEEEAKLIPIWLNHYMHTFPAIAVATEILLFKHKYPIRRDGIKILLSFCFVYTAWVMWIAFASGIWVYPFLEKMPWWAILAFFGCASVLAVLIYLLGEYACSWRWRETVDKDNKVE